MKRLLLIAALLLLSLVAVGSFDAKLWSHSHDGYVKHVIVPSGSAGLGPTAPSVGIIGTSFVLCFDANAEQAGVKFEIPSDWIGADDMVFKIYWTNEAGDALQNTETVIWNITYRVIDWDAGGPLGAGSTVALADTTTQSGAGVDGATHETEFVLDWDNADQPLIKGQVVAIQINRNATGDSYGGDACVGLFEFKFTSNDLPEH